MLSEFLAAEGDTVQVGQVIAIVGAGSGAAAAPAAQKHQRRKLAPEAPKAAPVVEETSSEQDRTIASPAARKLAREKGIDLSEISPVDPMGRVRVQDVAAHGSAPAPATSSSSTSSYCT